MEQIYYYSIGYYSYEDNRKEILINEKYYSKPKFDELIFDCLLRLIKKEENLEIFNSFNNTFDNYTDDIIFNFNGRI